MESEVMVTDFWKTNDSIKGKKHGFDDIFVDNYETTNTLFEIKWVNEGFF
jgi:hypothetical protein